MKKLAMAAILAGGLIFSTCTGADSALEKAKNSNTRNVTFILKNLYNPFCISARDGAVKAAEELDITLTVLVPDEGDNNDQLLALTEQAVDSGEPDVMVMFPADSIGFVPAVQMAVAADIPVVMLAANIRHDERIYETFVAANNREVGRAIGEELAKRLGYKGNVILVEGVPGSQNSIDRMGGVAESLAQYDAIQVIASVPGLGRKGVSYRVAGRDVMEELMAQHSDIQGIFCMVDELALGCIEALEAAGRFTNILVAGCDGTDSALESIKAGKLNFTCDLSPYNQGYKAVAAAAAIMSGEAVPPAIVTDMKIIDISNIGD